MYMLAKFLPGAAADFIQRLDAVCIHPLCNFGGDAGAGLRVQEIRGADLYRRGTGHNKLQCIAAGQDAAQPHHPMTGILTAPTACHTMRSAMGRMAGPESPAKVLLNTGRRFSRSMAQA